MIYQSFSFEAGRAFTFLAFTLSCTFFSALLTASKILSMRCLSAPLGFGDSFLSSFFSPSPFPCCLSPCFSLLFCWSLSESFLSFPLSLLPSLSLGCGLLSFPPPPLLSFLLSLGGFSFFFFFANFY